MTRSWVHPSIQELVTRNKLPINSSCLLCFIDLRGKPEKPFILPLREAVLTRVFAVGTTYTLVFNLGAFRRPVDTRAFSDHARSILPELHRFHQIPGTQEPTGYLWIDEKDQLQSQLTPAVTAIDKWPLEWENLVRDYISIMNAPDQYSKDFLDKDALTGEDQKFTDKSPFYVFYELARLPDRNLVQSGTNQGRPAFNLDSGASYELSFYQYRPTKSFPEVGLRLTADASDIQFTSNQERRFNTRYDMKRFIFSTPDSLSGSSEPMLISRVFHENDSENPVEDFYLNFEVKGSAVKIVLYAELTEIAQSDVG